jgi:hypothetical protein
VLRGQGLWLGFITQKSAEILGSLGEILNEAATKVAKDQLVGPPPQVRTAVGMRLRAPAIDRLIRKERRKAADHWIAGS